LEMEGPATCGWWSSAAVLQGKAANHPELLRSRAVGGERRGKRRAVSASGVDQEDERKRSIDDVSKPHTDDIGTGLGWMARDEPGGCLFIGQAVSGMEMA
jgi:hypothetical protein